MQLFLQTASQNSRSRPTSRTKVELQSGVRGAATHGPLIWALYKVEPKSVRICGASRWLKRIFESNVISAPSLSGDSDFQSVLKKSRNKMKRGNTDAFVLCWKSPGVEAFRHFCTCAPPSLLVEAQWLSRLLEQINK